MQTQGLEEVGERGLDERPGSWGMEVVAMLAVVGIERQGVAEPLHPSSQGPSIPAPVVVAAGNADGRLVVLGHREGKLGDDQQDVPRENHKQRCPILEGGRK